MSGVVVTARRYGSWNRSGLLDRPAALHFFAEIRILDRLALLEPAFLHHRAIHLGHVVANGGFGRVRVGDRPHRSVCRMPRARPRASSSPRARWRPRRSAGRRAERVGRLRHCLRIGLVVAWLSSASCAWMRKYGSSTLVSESAHGRDLATSATTHRDQTPRSARHHQTPGPAGAGRTTFSCVGLDAT